MQRDHPPGPARWLRRGCGCIGDGFSQTKSYRIRPVDGFDDVARAYYERVNALDAEDLADEPQLYSIEEVPTA